jgi:hypothetical protein
MRSMIAITLNLKDAFTGWLAAAQWLTHWVYCNMCHSLLGVPNALKSFKSLGLREKSLK